MEAGDDGGGRSSGPAVAVLVAVAAAGPPRGGGVGDQAGQAGAERGPRHLVRVVVGGRAVGGGGVRQRQRRQVLGARLQPGVQGGPGAGVRRAVVRLERVDAVVRVAALRAVEALLAVRVRVVPRVGHLLPALAAPPLLAVRHRQRRHALEHVLVGRRLVGGAGRARAVSVLHRLLCGQTRARQVTPRLLLRSAPLSSARSA